MASPDRVQLDCSEQVSTKALCEASARAFAQLWPAVGRANPRLSPERCFDAVVARILLTMARPVATSVGLDPTQLEESQLARIAEPMAQLGPLEALAYDRNFVAQLSAAHQGRPGVFSGEDVAAVYESLLALSLPDETEPPAKAKRRKRSGSYYTPRPLARKLAAAGLAGRTFDSPEQILRFTVLDPAVGAGVFLIEACRMLAERFSVYEPETDESELLARVATSCLHGVDVNPLSVAVCQMCLWLAVGNRDVPLGRFSEPLRHGDALVGLVSDEQQGTPFEAALEQLLQSGVETSRLDWQAAFPAQRGFDLVLGNPPWVAYAGRSAQPLPSALREYYSRGYRAWRGFPTLHGLFVERACQLAPEGTISLLLPSPVADLDGYNGVRQVVTSQHRVMRSLPEFGQDAFVGVTQPCFALVAEPSSVAQPSSECWQLAERQRASASAQSLEVPEVLRLIARARPFDAAHFKELGFQTSKIASQTLLLRAEAADALHTLALLEGRNINEFWMGPPKLFLRADAALLKQAGCRLRAAVDYENVDFVVRQTASVPIAALHGGLAFRNSLLAGFANQEFSRELLVALLNSSLYRALHVAGQRDARQAAFPQVKIKHLRALPRPPVRPRSLRALANVTTEQTQHGASPAGRDKLDRLVFDLFELPEDHRAAVLDFLAARAPRYCSRTPPSAPPPKSSLDNVARVLDL